MSKSAFHSGLSGILRALAVAPALALALAHVAHGAPGAGLPTVAAGAGAAVQTPSVVKQQVDAIQDRFATVLDEECPHGQCYAAGCKASRFETLDETQTSSLPGLEDEAPADKPQFRLASVVCEFTHEPTLDGVDLASVRQRVRQKVKTVGVELLVQARALEAKPRDAVADAEAAKAAAVPHAAETPPTWQAQLLTRLLPFIPWFLAATLLTLASLTLIWGMRRLGRAERRSPNARTRDSDQKGAGGSGAGGETAEPTPRMLLTRIAQLGGALEADKRLVELTLKKQFEGRSFDELSLFLSHFGPELLAGFKEKAEYRDALQELSVYYADHETDKGADTAWRFLDRLERDMTAAKVRIDAEPLGEHFSFLVAVDVDEFVGVLRDLTEAEAIAAVAYAPRRLRERFFTHANPAFTAKFVEHLTNVDKMSDSFVRNVAAKLRRIYYEKGDALKTIRVDRGPLLEEALNALEPARRRQLMADLGQSNPEFVRAVAPTMYFDDSLPLLPDAVLTEALLAVTPEEAGHYLALFPWGKELLGRVNPRLGDAVKRQMPQPPRPDSALAQGAREKIAAFVKSQHALGTIDLAQVNAKVVSGALA